MAPGNRSHPWLRAVIWNSTSQSAWDAIFVGDLCKGHVYLFTYGSVKLFCIVFLVIIIMYVFIYLHNYMFLT